MKKSVLLTLLALSALMMTACGNKEITFGNENGLMLSYNYVSMGSHAMTDVTDYSIEIYADNTAKLLIYDPTLPKETENASVFAFFLDETKVAELLALVTDSALLKKEDIGTDGCDGYYSKLIFYTPKEHIVGGYLAADAEYEKVVKALHQMIDVQSYIDEVQLKQLNLLNGGNTK